MDLGLLKKSSRKLISHLDSMIFELKIDVLFNFESKLFFHACTSLHIEVNALKNVHYNETPFSWSI